MNYKTYITYHKKEQIEQYKLNELVDDYHELYFTNNLSIGKNFLNPIWGEIVTMWYVWKYVKNLDFVGFNHYCRLFNIYKLPKNNECQTHAYYYYENIYDVYCCYHRKQDIDSLINILNNLYGENNKYVNYIMNHHIMISNCCFFMSWSNFDKMMTFIFNVLNIYSNQEGCEDDISKWESWCIKNFNFKDREYQKRVIGFLGERLISAWIITHLNVYIQNNKNDIKYINELN